MTARTRSPLVALVAAFVLALTPLVPGPAAQAAPTSPVAPVQDSPTLPVEVLDPLLAELTPVLELVSPIAYPACANAVLVSVLPGLLGLAIPPEVALVFGPLLVVCGAVPAPDGEGRVCAFDAAAQALLVEATKPLLGLALPVEVIPVEMLTGFVAEIDDALDLPGVPIGATIDGVVQCAIPPTTTTTTTPASPAPATPTPPEVTAPDVPAPTFGELQTLPPVDLSEVATPPAPPAAEPVETPVLRIVTQPRFRYPVVLAVPLLLLALGAFFGRALTTPLHPRRRP